MQELVILGTGNALVTKCYNTCFTLHIEGRHFLVDAGGGNGILRQLELADIALTDIDDMMLTHAHTDHLLGCVWVVRIMCQQMKQGKRTQPFSIYALEDALRILEWICRQCLPSKFTSLFGELVHFVPLEAGDCFESCGIKMRCFDTGSTKCPQFGVEMLLPEGQRLVCLGDEPLHDCNRALCQGADWLLCEAFCLASQADIFKPYEKNHSTALDAGRIAAELGVKNLLLYHTEDTQLEQRKLLYTTEAQCHYQGNVFVPRDLERLLIT